MTVLHATRESVSVPYDPIVTLIPVALNLNASLSMRLEDQTD